MGMMGYTVDELASSLRLSKQTVRRAIKSGALKASKIGRRVVILHDSVAEWLQREAVCAQ